MSAVFQAACDCRVQLSGQVGVILILEKDVGKINGVRISIQKLVGAETRKRTGVYTADVVQTCLEAVQIHTLQLL